MKPILVLILLMACPSWALGQTSCSWNFAASGGSSQTVRKNGIPVNSPVSVPGTITCRALFSNAQDPGDHVVEFFFWRCGPNYATAEHKFKVTITGPAWNAFPAPWSREFIREVGLNCGPCCADKQCDGDCDGDRNGDDDDDDGDGTADCDDDDDDNDGISDDDDENDGPFDEIFVHCLGPPDMCPDGPFEGGPVDPAPCCGHGEQGPACDGPCPPDDPDDFDDDGTPNDEDDDDDGDGIPDCEDPDDDNDGSDDGVDDDDDNDGTDDNVDGTPGGCDCGNDFDCDGEGNNTDGDDDNDGISDEDDPDDDNDGTPDESDPDDDNDGIPDDEDDTPGGDGGGGGPCNQPPGDHDCDEVPNNCDPDYQPCVDANSNGRCDPCDEDCPQPPCCPQKQVDHDCDNVPNLCDRDYVGVGPACPDLNDNRICDGCECDPSDPGYPDCEAPCADPPANDHDCDGVHNECDKDYDPPGCLDANDNRVCDHCEEDIPPIGPAPDLILPKAPTVEWDVPSLDLSSGAYDFDINLPWVGGGTRQLHVSTDPTAWNDSGLVSELPMSPILFTVVDNLRAFVRLMLQIMLLWSMGPRFIRIFHTT
jgi:hypothetical protein